MYLIALKMLVGDKAKYLGLIFAIASSTFLIAQQVSIFTGLMDRTTSQIRDVREASIWVMDPGVRYVDEIKSLSDSDVGRVRTLPEIEWAVRFFKGFGKATSAKGDFRQAILLGIDDATLIGVPRDLFVGSWEALREPDTIVLDDQGFRSLFPGVGLDDALGKTVEINDRRARVVGVCKPSPPFATFPVIYTRYSLALTYVGRERNTMSFVLAHQRPGVSVEQACAAIERATGLKARTSRAFAWETIWFYVGNTGIPVNFGITIITAIVVGAVISGQTLYLFVSDNLKNFASLKAIGASDPLLSRMVLLQAGLVGLLGMGTGLGATAFFFGATGDIPKLRGFILHAEVAAGTAVLVLAFTMAASLFALRRVRTAEPGMVFK
ncbi:MAG TPA: ABC transporter permease [Phycisphaerales bacterium]